MREIKHQLPQKKRGCWSAILKVILISTILNVVVGIIFLIPMTEKSKILLGMVVTIGSIVFIILYFKKGRVNIRDKKTKEITYNPNVVSLNINNAVEVFNPFAGVFICGGAGSGKSTSLVEPIIYNAGVKGSCGVVYDFKFPELAQHVETAYKNENIVKRIYLSFTDLSISTRINPIDPILMKNESYAREYAYAILANINPSMISKPDFWSDSSLVFLSSVFWFLKKNHPKYCTLPHAISLILQPDYETLLNLLETDTQCADMIAPILTAVRSGAQNQLAGMISSLQVSLTKINTPELYYLTSESEASLDLNSRDPGKPAILVLGNDPTLSSTYGPVIGLFLTAISKNLNQKNKYDSLFLIDEFPTVYIPNVENLPATARSNRVSTVLACQDISQMVDKYGKTKADNILSNLGNQFYGRTTSIETAERVSKLFGKEEKIFMTTTKGRSGMQASSSTSYSSQLRDLIRVQDMAKIGTGTFAVNLSEGSIRQGVAYIPPNPNCYKTPLEQIRQVSEYEIGLVYNEIKRQAMYILNG